MKETRMPRPNVLTSNDRRATADLLMPSAEDSPPVGLVTAPIDVSLLEQLELDECGRRSRWLPADCLL